jgi:hypothetical protein
MYTEEKHVIVIYLHSIFSRYSTLGSNGYCDTTMDDSQTAFLYRSPIVGGQNVTCAGLNFSDVKGMYL